MAREFDSVPVTLVPGMTHMDVRNPALWCPDCQAWLPAPKLPIDTPMV